LIRATKTARNTLLDIEELSEEELDKIKARFGKLARLAREESNTGGTEFARKEGSEELVVVPPIRT